MTAPHFHRFLCLGCRLRVLLVKRDRSDGVIRFGSENNHVGSPLRWFLRLCVGVLEEVLHITHDIRGDFGDHIKLTNGTGARATDNFPAFLCCVHPLSSEKRLQIIRTEKNNGHFGLI